MRKRTGERHTHTVPKTIPVRAHPLVRPLFELMIRECASYELVAKRSGVSWHTIRRWRRGQPPDLQNLDACYNVFDYRLEACKSPVN